MDIRKKFAKSLREKRKDNHLTQEQAAEILDISCRYFQKFEAAEVSHPNLKLMCKIAKEFNIDFAQLLNED